MAMVLTRNTSNGEILTQGLYTPSRKSALATVGNGTLTAAMLLSGLIMRTGPTGAYSDTMPTAAEIVAAMDNPRVGDSFDFEFVNGVAYAATIVAGTLMTLAGTTAVSASKVRRFRCTVEGTEYVEGQSPWVTLTGIGEMTA